MTERTGTPRGAGGPLDVEYLSSLLKQGGKLDRAVPSFEYRPAQVQMLEAVAYSFNNAEKLIVEAGTGTGKSIAYLIPSFYFSLSTGRPVVISTNTINLQEQLLGKDIPDLAAALQLPADFRAVTLKGRSNYLCLRRFQINRDAIAREEGGTELVPRLNGWLSTTNSGDVSELGLMGKQGVLWTRICAREGECLAEKCRFHEQGLCFLMAARAKARNASIVITNHALLIADLVSGGQLLPDYKHLIIDEGHHLEDVATDQFGWSVSQNGIAELVKEIEQEMVSLNRFQRSGRVPSQRKHDLAGLVDECRRCSRDLALRSEAFFKAVSEPAIDAGSARETYEKTLRITDEMRLAGSWGYISQAANDLGLAAGQAVAALGKTFNGLDGLDKDDQLNDFRLGLVRFANKLDEIKEHLESAVDNPDKGAVYWISITPGDAARARQYSKKYQETQSLAFHAAPLEVSQRLNQDLFSSKDTVVLTSATLASGRSFQFTATRLGIDADNEVLLDSPFDYMQSALLCLTDDIPLPDTDGYQSAVEKALNLLLPETNGRTLVLFTSHLALRKTHSAIKPVLEARKIRVLGQGIDGSAEQVLMDFKSDPRAVLLGASSLWEGIDVVGEALSVLVIPRLPFSVPTDPVFSARSEGYADPFTDYALPQAVLRFKQGFGRLIRSRSDRGAVVLLDRRIHQRSYGQAFITALPPCNISRNKLSDLPRVVSRWLALVPPQAAANKG